MGNYDTFSERLHHYGAVTLKQAFTLLAYAVLEASAKVEWPA
jgi:hypothetical protein